MTEEWLSPELLSALRTENLRSDLTQKWNEIVRQTQALIVQRLRSGTEQEIVGYLRSGAFSSHRLADIINFIRQDETAFKEWHQSEIVKLFAPLVFQNKKNSAGYFF